jgi:tetratricopeptide (TPR) repeat protein
MTQRSIRSAALSLLLLAGLASLSACEAPTKESRQPLPPSAAVPQTERITKAHQEAKRAARATTPEKQEEYYRRAVAYYAEYAPAWNNLGVALMDQQRYLEAAEAFQRAADLAPSDPRPLYNHGLLFFRRAYPREALPYFLEALDRDPHYLPALRAAIQSEVRQRDVSQATLDRIQSALLLETDPGWQRFFELQRIRIEADLESQKKRQAPGTGG